MRQRRLVGAGSFGALALLVAGCAPASPVTEYTAANGSAVRVQWRDYPGHAYSDPDQVLQAPVAEKADDRADNLLGALERRLSAELDLEWEDGPDADAVNPYGGNGYGGDSLYVSYNSGTRETLEAPEFEDWDRVLEIVDEVAPVYGFEQVELQYVARAGEEYAEEAAGENRVGDDVWQWSGAAFAPGQFLFVTISDVERDPTGEAAAESEGAADNGWNPSAITLSYGATTLHSRDRKPFLERLEPFRGLDRPEATASD